MTGTDQAETDLAGRRLLVLLPSIPLQGMERANLQIMRMMRERGADVLFVTDQTHGAAIRAEAERIGCAWTTAPFSASSTPILGRAGSVPSAWLRILPRLAEIRRGYRPTHVYIADLGTFLQVAPLLRRCVEPVVFRLPNPPDAGLGGWRAWAWRLVWRRGVERLCDVLVCNCEYSRARLADSGIDPHRARVVYNCVAERDQPRGASAGPGQASDAPRLDPRRVHVVFLGRVRPEKGVAELIEAARRIVAERSDVDFHLCGEHRWQNPFAAEWIARIAAEGLAERIRIFGPIEDVFGLLSQCHVHVCPSRSLGESFPNVVLEAKHHAMPSVVFPCGGLPEAVSHLAEGYVCRDTSAEALYEGIRHFTDDTERCGAVGREAARSLQRFSRRRAADAWVDIFQGAAKRRPRA